MPTDPTVFADGPKRWATAGAKDGDPTPMPLISQADLMMVRAEARHAQTGTTMHELALVAGTAAAAIFMISQLPMLIKARRTKDLASYSIANIGLANVGNVLYAVYIVQVPVGPAWAIHGFNLTTAGLMLFWYLRYGWRHSGEPREVSLYSSSSSRRTSQPPTLM
jgi:uncharacterized protein with PQ loop repeat